MRNILSKVSPRARRNTIDIPPTQQDEVRVEVSNEQSVDHLSVPSPTEYHGTEEKTEKLKKGPGYPFRDRDRVKIIAPYQYTNRTGYIVEAECVENTEGLLEIELDHKLDDMNGYEKLMDPTIKRERIMIKNPSIQLKPYKYMKCQKQHFVSDMTAETLLRISNIATFILVFGIIALLLGINKKPWNNKALFYLYCLTQSFCVGLGFFCVLVLSFIGVSIKRLSKNNNLKQLGAVNDECTTYYWLKSTHWKPWWICGRNESVIQFILKQIGKVLITFYQIFIISIILYISDECEWYLVMICIILIIGPSVFAIDIIKNREMIQFM